MTNFVDDIGLDVGLGLPGLRSVTDPLEDAFKTISGQSAEDAAREAARRQEAAANRAIDVQEAAQLRLEETLAPFVSALGTDLLPQVSSLFGASAGESILNDPVLQSLQGDAERRILQNQAVQGRLSTQETSNALQDAFLRSGLGLLSQQRGDLLGALGMGQASAAQTGVSGAQTGANVGNLLTQIGNAQAAGLIGGQQARSQGLNNLIGLGSMAFNAFGGVGGFGGAPGGGSVGSIF